MWLTVRNHNNPGWLICHARSILKGPVHPFYHNVGNRQTNEQKNNHGCSRSIILLSSSFRFVFSCIPTTPTETMKIGILISLLVFHGVESVVMQKSKESSVLNSLTLKCYQGMGPSNTRSLIEHALLCEMDKKCLGIANRVNGTVGYTTCVRPDDPNKGSSKVAPGLSPAIFLRNLEDSPVPGIFMVAFI